MEDKKRELECQINQLLELRESAKMNRKEFAAYFEIPLRTLEDWEAGRRKMPEYLLKLMTYKVGIEFMNNKQ